MTQLNKIGKVATNVVERDGCTSVIYHDTIVVEFTDDMVWLNNGTWWTATTKTRMNQASNQFGLGFSVSQVDHQWYVNCPDGEVRQFTPQGRCMFTRKGK